MTVALPMSMDKDVLTIPEAARLSGINRHEFYRWLEHPGFREAVVIDVPGKRVRISRPRLLRYLHKDALSA